MGINVPVMGTDADDTGRAAPSALGDALFTRVQQRVLGLLFGQPERRFQSAELIRLVGAGAGATHRVLTRLADAGLVSVAFQGRQKFYQARSDSPVFEELAGLVRKTVGMVGPLREALAPFEERIHAAFVYGSVASGRDRAESDVDLLVLSDDLDYGALFDALQHAESRLARPVNPNVMTPEEWCRKRRVPDSFVSRVGDRPKLFVIGSEDDL